MLHTDSHDPFKKNARFIAGIIMTIIEGILSASVSFSVFILVYWLLNGEISASRIKALTIAVAVIFVIRFLLYGVGYTLGQIGGAQISRNIRLFLGDKIKRIPMSHFTKGNMGGYINVLTSDVAKYEQILTHKTGNLVKNGVISLMIICFSLKLYAPAGVVLLIAAAVFVPEMLLSFKIVNKYGSERNRIYNNSVSSVVEYITGIQTLRAYGMTGVKNEKLTECLKDFSDISYRYEARGIPVSFSFNIIQWLSLPAVMVIGAKPWLSGTLTGADFLMLCMVPVLLTKLLMSISIDVFSYKNMLLSKTAITNIVNEDEEPVSSQTFAPSGSEVSFKDVCFSYDAEREVLQDIDMTIPEGKFTAIVGDSGSGKSTLMNMIGKYYDPCSGTVCIGGLDLKNFPSEQVLSYISLVDQDVFLFNDTVRENIRHARPSATDAEIEAACERAGCTEFISRLANGYDTEIGENGCLLSGGERQRLSIARAILRDSPIVLLDEATSALDIENELKVKHAIQQLLGSHKTVVMIAHTLPIIRYADQIVVIDDKTIAETGTHEELLAKHGKYFRMWNCLY